MSAAWQIKFATLQNFVHLLALCLHSSSFWVENAMEAIKISTNALTRCDSNACGVLKDTLKPKKVRIKPLKSRNSA